MPKRYWLMKTEPGSYSIDDLKRDGRTGWTGVRNYKARNYMRDEMKKGDEVLFYHSSADPPGVAGIARVCSAQASPDPTALDSADSHYDPKATPEDAIWVMVDVEFVERFPAVVALQTLKADSQLAGMWVLKRGMRLSIQPVERDHFERIRAIGRMRSRTQD
jgi:predicted RNA-binding protein with PUA-like domain